MMRKLVFIFGFLVLLTSCRKEINQNNINKINGYWEIEKVFLANGEKKDYTINQTIDYFEIKNKKGFRQKVMPQVDGTYLTNNLKENISITNESGRFYINYSTNFGKWKEEILEVKDSILILLNKDNLEYHYKKQIPFSLK